MSSDRTGSTSRVVNEPLRLVLSPQEIAYIEERIAHAKRQLRTSFILPAAYVAALFGWRAFLHEFGAFYEFVTVAMVLAFFIIFGITVHLMLSGAVDWVMFARYRRDHRAFLNRYNRD